MAHVLNVVYGSTTVTMGNVLMAFVPKSPNNIDDPRLTDSFTVYANQNMINSLELAMGRARAWDKDKTGDRVYLNFQAGSTGSVYRSQIYNGQLSFTNHALGSDWVNQGFETTVAFERDAFWEGPEAQIPLTNANGTADTSGLTIKNCGDGTGSSPTIRDNTVSISSASVSGDLPGATRLEITNTYNNAARNYTWWIGHNVNSDPTNFVHVIEAESTTVIGGVGDGPVTHANYSSGNAHQNTVYNSNFVSGYSITYKWPLTTAMLNAVRGNYVRAMARFPDVISDTTLWVKLQIMLGVTAIWSGPQVLLKTSEIQELGSFRLPPYLLQSGDLYPLDLQMIVVDTTGAANKTIILDSIELMPLDSWRKLDPAGYGQAYEVRIVDDGIDDALYTDGWTDAGKTGHYVGYGNPVMLHPGKDQKLYFMWENSTSSGQTDLTASVKLYYRPRRRTI